MAIPQRTIIVSATAMVGFVLLVVFSLQSPSSDGHVAVQVNRINSGGALARLQRQFVRSDDDEAVLDNEVKPIDIESNANGQIVLIEPSKDELADDAAAEAAAPVAVSVFVMSKCPDAAFCANQWFDQLKELRAIITMDINFFGSEAGNGRFNCMHGPAECEGNMQQLCAKNVSSVDDELQWMDFVKCQGKTFTSVPGNANRCAQQVGMDWAAIDACVKNGEGAQLFRDSLARQRASGATKSCTLQLNGVTWCVHDGIWKDCHQGNTAAALKKSICKLYQGPSPAICN